MAWLVGSWPSFGSAGRTIGISDTILEADVGPVTHAASLSLLELVEICLDNADVDGARKLFGQAEVFIRGAFAGPDGVSWLARRGVLVSLAAGDLASAAQWNVRVEDKFWQGAIFMSIS